MCESHQSGLGSLKSGCESQSPKVPKSRSPERPESPERAEKQERTDAAGKKVEAMQKKLHK